MVKYEELSTIPTGSLVRYKEYKLDRHERLKLNGEIEGTLFLFIPAGTALSADEIKTYYNIKGDEGIQVLSNTPHHRLVVQVGFDKQNIPIYSTINLIEYFMSEGHQTVEYEDFIQAKPTKPSEILGFNSYEFGSKFKT